MSPLLTALFLWLHTLATVVFIGYFVVLAVIMLPVLAKTDSGPALSQVSKQSRGWMYTALIVFAFSGVMLMFLDPDYLGLGDLSNSWSLAMLIKHLTVLVMIAAGFWFNAIQRVGQRLNTTHEAASAFARFRGYVNFMAASGVLVLLLTALAEAQ